MQLSRLFSSEKVKGSRNYLNSQKKYEVLRTLLYFSISISLLIAGYLQTKNRANMLTIVAVLGCMPACKSAVDAIMFLRYKSCREQAAEAIEKCSEGLDCLYDCVFTSYKINFSVSHLAVRGNTICGFSEDADFNEKEFYAHIDALLKQDGQKNITVKIFTNLTKYTERLEQLKNLESDSNGDQAIIATLKSVML